MKIVVTGAAGFIGSHVAERLALLGHDVVGVDALTSYYDPEIKRANVHEITAAGVEFRQLDLADGVPPAVLSGAEIVYHFAAQPGISATTPFADYLRNNFVATHHLLEACAPLASLRCFVNCSTSSVYGAQATDAEDAPPKPISHYGVTKLAAEQLVLARHREAGFPACSLRLFSVYGPRERPEKLYPRLIRSILEETGFPLYEGAERHSRSFTYVEDVVEAMVRVIDHSDRLVGEIVNIGSDTEITTGRGIEIVEQIMGRKAKLDRQPRRPGDQMRTSANIAKARRLLGFDPATNPEDGLRRQVEWTRRRFEIGT